MFIYIFFKIQDDVIILYGNTSICTFHVCTVFPFQPYFISCKIMFQYVNVQCVTMPIQMILMFWINVKHLNKNHLFIVILHFILMKKANRLRHSSGSKDLPDSHSGIVNLTWMAFILVGFRMQLIDYHCKM